MVTVKWNEDEKNMLSAGGTVDAHLFDPYGNEVSQRTKMTRGGIDAGDEETTRSIFNKSGYLFYLFRPHPLPHFKGDEWHKRRRR